MNASYVYILSNPSMPGVVKIGRSTSGGHSRGRDLFQTGVPERFVLEFEIYSPDHEMLESLVHEKMSAHRVNPKREFFRCAPYEAIEALVSAYLVGILGTGSYLVDELAYTASVDLAYQAHRLNLHWADVFDAVSHLSEFAIRKAVDEALDARARRRQELSQNG
jgi:hypothetical protein